jgi:hypothetical protein
LGKPPHHQRFMENLEWVEFVDPSHEGAPQGLFWSTAWQCGHAAAFHSLPCQRTTQEWATVALPSRLIGVIAELVMFAILRRKPHLFYRDKRPTRIKILENTKLENSRRCCHYAQVYGWLTFTFCHHHQCRRTENFWGRANSKA